MSDRQHFTIEDGFESEAEARGAVDSLLARFKRDLTKKGYGNFSAPERPSRFDGEWEERDGCRVLVAYLPPWSLSVFRDKFVARIDAFATKQERV